MPIYEYACEACGNKFEKLVRRTDDVLAAGCPSCGQRHLTQEFSTFAPRAGSASASSSSSSEMCGGSCPAGMCGTPGLWGRN